MFALWIRYSSICYWIRSCFSLVVWQQHAEVIWFADFGILLVITAPSNSNHSQLFCLDALNLCDKLMRFNYTRINSVRRKLRITFATSHSSELTAHGIVACLFVHSFCLRFSFRRHNNSFVFVTMRHSVSSIHYDNNLKMSYFLYPNNTAPNACALLIDRQYDCQNIIHGNFIFIFFSLQLFY